MPFFDDSDRGDLYSPGQRGGSVTAPAAAAGLSEQEQYINGLYLSFMGRPATPGELRTWVGRNVNLSALAERLQNSDEGRRYAARAARGGVPSVQTFGTATQTPAGGATGGTAYSDEALQAIFRKHPPTNEGMRAAIAEANATFGPGIVELLEHPSRLDKVRVPGGRVIDAIIGAGGESPSWGWIHDTGGGGGATTPDLLAPFTEQFTFRDFVAPTLEQATQAPGFQFRLGEGLKALERSKAASGTVLNPATAKALNEFAQNAASAEYADVYGRQANEYDRAYNNALGQYLERRSLFEANQDRPYQKLYQFSNLGANVAGQMANMGLDYGRNMAGTITGGTSAYNDLLTDAAAANAGGRLGSAGAWTDAFGNIARIGTESLYGYYRDRARPRR